MILEFAKMVGVPALDILGESRKGILPDLRHVYWKLLYDNTRYNLEEIGRLNDRNHASIWYGINKVNGALKVGDRRIVGIWERVKDIRIDPSTPLRASS